MTTLAKLRPVALAAALAVPLMLPALRPAAAATDGDSEAAVIAKGAYLARAGDCVACHTAPGGRPFAGGLALDSGLGRIFSTNITPDKAQGIGNYSEAQFAAALRQGIRADGAHLYPAMPYPSYAKITDADIHALYVYFMKGVEAVPAAPPATALSFPFSQRWGMVLWNRAFAGGGPFAPDSSWSPDIQRGAYLVEGLGHCGSCHTPRNLAMAEKAYDAGQAAFLAGGDLNGWPVPSLRGRTAASKGFASWDLGDIVDYLGSGRNAHAAVGGEMTSVVAHSLGDLNGDDLRAIAVYLKSIAVDDGKAPADAADKARATAARLTAATGLAAGERLYLDNCGACHFVSGQGAARVFPALDGSSLVNGEKPDGLIQVILAGAATPSTDRAPSVLPMPAFGQRLSDREVADLASFLRQGWSNQADAVDASMVANVRARLPQAPQ